MEGSFSPILRKIAGEVASKPKRSFTAPTEVCLEDWWLSKPSNGDGIAVSGRPIEIRKCDDARRNFSLASPTRRFASREFHSTKIVKRHGGTLVETSDGFLISLCGFINDSRSQNNGYSSEICKNFICGFPFNWDDFTAQCIDDAELKSNENILGSFTPADLDLFNGAELHDLVLSLTNKESDLFIEKISMSMLKSQTEHGVEVQCSISSPTSCCGEDGLISDDCSAKVSVKQMMNIEQCSISAPSSLLDADVLTSDNKITNASQNRKCNAASTHISSVKPSISSPSSPPCLLVGPPSNNGGFAMPSKKQRRTTSLDVSFEKSVRTRSMCNSSK